MASMLTGFASKNGSATFIKGSQSSSESKSGIHGLLSFASLKLEKSQAEIVGRVL
jgi:hypothetical protein